MQAKSELLHGPDRRSRRPITLRGSARGYADLPYLPDDILALSDRLSMWHSLELRVPAVDHGLVDLSACMPHRLRLSATSQERMLKKIAECWLPRSIIYHRKQGFESPMAAWLRTDLAGLVRAELTPPRLERMGLFDAPVVRQLLDENLSRQRRNNKIPFH